MMSTQGRFAGADVASVMAMEPPATWKPVVEKAIPQDWIKKRQGPGGKEIEYIEGQKIAQILAEATGNRFSFVVLDYFIQPSVGKVLKVSVERNGRRFMDPVHEVTCPSCQKAFRFVKGYFLKDVNCAFCQYTIPIALYPGEPVTEPQPPVAHVLGQLSIPGIGVVSHWGSKVIEGGAYDQDSAFKAATTDALKKCANTLGIGRDLYDKDEIGQAQESPVYGAQTAYPQAGAQPSPQGQPSHNGRAHAPVSVAHTAAPAPAPAATAQVQPAQPQANGNGKLEWPQDQVERLQRLMNMMGLPRENRPALDPLVAAWSKQHGDGTLTTYRDIRPDNIRLFCDYLETFVARGE